MKFRAMLSMMFVMVPGLSLAQVATEGVQSFGQAEGAWKRQEPAVAEKPQLLSIFAQNSGNFAINNIVHAEQVFCYEVLPQNPNYEGYTLNGFPIRGFCGVLGDQVRDIFVEQFLSNGANIDFERSEQCVIQPKLMIRFVRGVDYTDMLLSAPCHSFAIFYGGNVSVYNFRPGAEIIDTFVNSLTENRVDFVSPALLNQVLPVGVPQTEQQRRLVNRRNEPIRQWEETVKANETQKAEEAKRNATGWNRLKNLQMGTSN